MKFSYPVINKPFKFEGFTCYPIYYSEHYAGGKYLYVDMFHEGTVEQSYIIQIDHLTKLEWYDIDLPIEWFDSFEGIGGKVDKIGTIYYRYSSKRITVEEAGDACYLDFPNIDKRKAGFLG